MLPKKVFKFTCFKCNKKSQSVNEKIRVCRKCRAWGAPGVGQRTIFDIDK